MTEADETRLRDLLVHRGWQIERLSTQVLTLSQQVQALTERLALYEQPANQPPADPTPPQPATEPPPTPPVNTIPYKYYSSRA
jgi:hypothetical protein